MAENYTGNDYVHAQPYGICDRCGFKFRLKAMRTEWTNLKVCGDCYDPRPEHLDPPYITPNEGAPLPNSRPDELIEASDDDQLDTSTGRPGFD